MAGEVAIGVDLGGTKVEVALVDRAGTVLGKERKATDAARGADAVVADLVDLIRDVGRALPSAAPVGVGVAGQVDPQSGTVFAAPNLAWRDYPLKARLAAGTGRPVFVLNDVQAATVGEWRFGAGRGARDLACVFVGTGIGGGIVAGGRLQQGASGSLGEIGHLVVQVDGPPCRCGGRGCLEALAGGASLAGRAQELARREPGQAQALLALAGGAEAVTAQHVFAAARTGDPLALHLRAEVVAALGAGLASVLNAFNPRYLVLGGGVVEGARELFPLVAEEVGRRALASAWRSASLVRAALGEDAGVVGAASFAADHASLHA